MTLSSAEQQLTMEGPAVFTQDNGGGWDVRAEPFAGSTLAETAWMVTAIVFIVLFVLSVIVCLYLWHLRNAKMKELRAMQNMQNKNDKSNRNVWYGGSYI